MAKADVLMIAPMLPLVIDKLSDAFTLHRLWEASDRDAFLRDVGPQIRGLAVGGGGHQPIGAALYDRLPNLQILSSFGVGYDHIDAREAGRRGIVVTNTPGVLDDEVADLAIGLLFATIRQLPQSDRYLRQGHWLQKPFPLTATLRGRTVGILGLGRIGKAIAKRITAFGVPVMYHGRTEQADVPYRYCPSLVDLAESVDVLIVIAPGGAGTKHMVNAEVLKALGPNGIVINVARGSLIDEQALIEALRNRTILSAGLDVFEDEPHVPQALIDMEHTVLLPHVGSATVHTRNAMGQLVVDNRTSWFGGRGPLTPVQETAWTGMA
jgi:lactate dehydrogenase-like 2-hydroxyacid dehydrogenase